MEQNPEDAYEGNARKFLQDAKDVYVLNKSGTLYEPRFETARNEPLHDTIGENKNSSFYVHVLRDWFPTIISALTLLLLGATVFYAHKQWLEAQ